MSKTYLAVASLVLLLISCRNLDVAQVADFSQQPALPPVITVVNWNAQKGVNPLIPLDLDTMIRNEQPDLVFLQEARADLVDDFTLGGYFASGWSYPWPGGKTIGVMTLSDVSPSGLEPVPTQHREFTVTAPKVSLISEFPLVDGRTLMTVNLHLLNFERWSMKKIGAQLSQLEAYMAQHRGPIILAGDFNTWNEKRLELVYAMTDELGLVEIDEFGKGRKTGDQRSRMLNRAFGVQPELPLDRIFVRGFTPLLATVLDYYSSDHRPIKVRLMLDGS